MIKLDSSVIESVGYDLDSQTVIVNFKNGTKYLYFDVLYTEYKRLVDSPSSGAYLNRNFKGRYAFERVS